MPGKPGARASDARGGSQRQEGRSSRRADLRHLGAQPVDVLVIGGGITGTGIARDAAMRGLKTALVEQHDLGWGTSSRSSRLVHGGLRYLEQGALRLVSEALRERAVLLGIAPHLVWPVPFVFPVHRGDRVGRWRLAAGMWAYDLLALFRNVRAHRMLGKRALLEREPMLRERGLLGGARYFDAQCDDARLVVATARSAIHAGALVANYAVVRALVREHGRVVGAAIEDLLTGESGIVRASVVVNATGPWADRVRALEDSGAAPLLRPTKGVHIIVDRGRIGHHDAITFLSPIDGRVIFALPWGELSYVGTTDTDVTTPDDLGISEDDLVYLLRSLNARFPSARLKPEDVRGGWAGVRPLLSDGAARAASDRSREHTVIWGAGGMLTVAGGKLTTYRVMAQQVVDEVVRTLRRRDGRLKIGRADTDAEPLPGGEARDLEPFRQLGVELGIPRDTIEHLLRHYGTEAAGVYNIGAGNRRLFRRLAPPHPACEAEVVHATRRELACRVEDFLVRRVHVFYEAPERGIGCAPRVAQLMGEELGWDAATIESEAARYRDLVAEAIPAPR